MKEFLGEDFLLENGPAETLYHKYAEAMPIVDYHCHIDPREIWEDKRYPNIAQLWLGVGGSRFGDHYKWRLMRSFGVEEESLTGEAPDETRFQKWAECLGKAAGNPLYHWSHLELRRYFGYGGVLNGRTWKEVWTLCNRKLAEPGMGVRGLITRSNVRLLCTTDDPADSLEWHRRLAADKSFPVKVLPAWRPDRALQLEKPDYPVYLERLAQAAGREIRSFADLCRALAERMDAFDALGCRASDHALETVTWDPAAPAETEALFRRRLAGAEMTAAEGRQFRTACLTFLAGEYRRRGWVMQLHYGCRRDNNSRQFRALGPDTGYDCILNQAPSAGLAEFLNGLEEGERLPRTILYSLNPNDNQAIGSILGCFQDASAVSRIQQGSAWWFNDHKAGMEEQLTSLASLGNLSGFVGMLTDSRSFLSYTRHEYFRRILCNLLGSWVERGEFPWDEELLGGMVRDICYNNAVRYFGFPLECR